MISVQYAQRGFLSAAGVALYVSCVVLVISNGQALFGEKETVLIPIFMLTLFVLSATVTGLLVLGRPIHLYLTGSRKEAFVLLASTLAWLAVFVLSVGVLMALQ